MNYNDLQQEILAIWDNPGLLDSKKHFVLQCLDLLNSGELRVASFKDDKWITHEYLKKAILLSFRINKNIVLGTKEFPWFDKIANKFENYSAEEFSSLKLRTVPLSFVRYSAYLANNVVVMPSFINMGAYIDSGTLIDSYVTIGSCAQIGENCHISSGVVIGGVLEPIVASPTIIENNCFIGANSSIVEGVVVKQGSVIASGVHLGVSTKILDSSTGEIIYGVIPSGSVVVPGTIPSKNGYSTLGAIIVKKVDEQTRAKTSINDLLRED